MMDLIELQAIVGRKDPEIEAIFGPYCGAMEKYEINTPRRRAMFAAQTIVESGGYRYLEELGSGEEYEGRADLGNTEPGDGPRFKGRGIIQLTGRSNYARCSSAIYGSSQVLLDNPESVAEPEVAAEAAGWYWKWKNINQNADAGDLMGATRKINGGLNGFTDRQRYYTRACIVLGLA